MSRVKSKNTKPEIKVRSFLHRLGFRFSLRRKELPGKPDIVLKKYNTIIFVHGCFWHLCPHCKGGRLPKSNLEYWKAKLTKNKKRDKEQIQALENMRWSVVVVWECQTKNEEQLHKALNGLLISKRLKVYQVNSIKT